MNDREIVAYCRCRLKNNALTGSAWRHSDTPWHVLPLHSAASSLQRTKKWRPAIKTVSINGPNLLRRSLMRSDPAHYSSSLESTGLRDASSSPLSSSRAGVEFIACDNPHANRLTIHILAAMAEHEGRLISERTKAGLAAARERGVEFGNGGQYLTSEERHKGQQTAKWPRLRRRQ